MIAMNGSEKAGITLFVATRKGAWLYHGDRARRTWRTDGPHFLGHIIHHLAPDPRDRKTVLAAAKTGHLGPTIFRSTDFGATWLEAKRPPAFPKAPEGEIGRAVDHTFWLTPGHPDETGVWYAGVSPQGLFRSEDHGDTWEGVAGFNERVAAPPVTGGAQDGTPDGPKLHSIIVDPRDAAHLYVGMSSGGVHESLDAGKSWAPMVDGLNVVGDFDASQLSFHDPHRLALCPSKPDRLYQQNHCGVYRIDRPSREWRRIGRNMPKEIGDVGFPIVVHPRDAETAWVFPMDGTDVWPRTSPGGRPAAYVTRDGGESWRRLDRGLPPRDAWWTVLRQAMTNDHADPVGLYFGTTSGAVLMSADEGEHWSAVAEHLPPVYALETSTSA
jgi:photosystem II stability/assembly factor-like uncharacterized protein